MMITRFMDWISDTSISDGRWVLRYFGSAIATGITLGLLISIISLI